MGPGGLALTHLYAVRSQGSGHNGLISQELPSYLEQREQGQGNGGKGQSLDSRLHSLPGRTLDNGSYFCVCLCLWVVSVRAGTFSTTRFISSPSEASKRTRVCNTGGRCHQPGLGSASWR